jgi:hypothetical protein
MAWLPASGSALRICCRIAAALLHKMLQHFPWDSRFA